jgi:opacity protein-like surface antigen
MSSPSPLVPRSVATVVLLALGWTTAAAAEPQSSVTLPDEQRPAPVPVAESAWWREGVGLLGALWDDARLRLRDDVPDWLHHQSHQDRASTPTPYDTSAAYIVLQEDRADGTDLVTLRYDLGQQGALRAYAGAGLNRAQYYVDEDAAGPSMLTRRNRHSAVGPAAEFGAELALNERVRVNADVRWADLDGRAEMLRGAYGPVAADPVTVGVSVGYRFR